MKPVITELDLLHLGRAVLHCLIRDKIVSKADLIEQLPTLGIDQETGNRLFLFIQEIPNE